MTNYSIPAQIIGIVMLTYTIALAQRNPIINSQKTKVFIIASLLTIGTLLLEIIECYIISHNNYEYITLHKIIIILGFITTNLIIYVLLSLNDNGKFSRNSLLTIPLIINIIVYALSYWTGWIFYIDSQGQYYRGIYFFLQLLINMFYYILLIISIFINDNDYDSDDIKFLSSIFSLPIIALILQITYSQFYILWVTVALSLMLYYVFLRELYFKFDAVSDIKNRRAFTNKMTQLNKSKIKTGVVVLDLNELKKINDNLGHDKGDEIIYKSAKFLQESFVNVGTAYRIGGDEFSVLCINSSAEHVEAALMKLQKSLEEYNKNNAINIIFAYGYHFYTGDNDIFKIFEIADKKMYEHKAIIKGLCKRRREDKL